MKQRIAAIALLLSGALVVSACSSGSSDSADTTVASSGGATTTVADDGSGGTDTTVAPEAPTTTMSQEPAIGGVDLIEQTTPTSGGGTRPLLEWVAVDGAALYFVTIYTESGGPYWSAVTEEIRTYVGGPLQIPAGRTGPTVSDGYTWTVVAEDAEGNLLAASPISPIAP